MPPSSMTYAHHVNGPIIPQCSIGALDAYLPLGVCEEGADITIEPLTRPIRTDAAGGPVGAEQDVIFLNATVTIRFKLVPFVGVNINQLRSRAIASRSTDGRMVESGTVFGPNALFIGLYLPVAIGADFDPDGPWWFRSCRVVKPGDVTVGTKATKPVFEFRAINYWDQTVYASIRNNVLYSRTAPP